MKPFPKYDDVFYDNVKKHRKHFLPLFSINPSIVLPELDIDLHIVITYEPFLEGSLGEHTEKYADLNQGNGYNQQDQYAFKLIDGKYQFAGDFRFFCYESHLWNNDPHEYDEMAEEIEEDRKIRRKSWKKSRKKCLQYGRLTDVKPSDFDKDENEEVLDGFSCSLIHRIGGSLGNEWDQGGVPKNQHGKPMIFVCGLSPIEWAEGAADFLLVFYDPDEEIALFQMIW